MYRHGRKLDETKTIQLEVSENDHVEGKNPIQVNQCLLLEKPKFPIRIPIEKMKPKKNYLQVRKSEASLDDKLYKIK